MKIQYILFTAIAACNTVSAQTGIIAHKSHSGNAATFALAAPGNFGAPPARIMKIERINDTTVVQTMDRWGGNRADTIYNHPLYSDPNISADSLKEIMKYDDTEIIENKAPGKEAKPTIVKPETIKSEEADSPGNSIPQEKQKRKRKGSLLLLWILGGGMFTGILVLGSKKARRSDATSKFATFP